MNKKVTIAAIKNAAASTKDITEIEWNGLVISVKYTVGFSDVMLAVARIVRHCFVGEDEHYVPEAEHFALLNEIVSLYTNISLPKDMDDRYALLLKIPVDELIVPAICTEQIQSIKSAVKNQIAYRIRMKEDQVKRQLTEIYAIIDGMQAQMDAVYSGVTGEDISNLAKAIVLADGDPAMLAFKNSISSTNEGGK